MAAACNVTLQTADEPTTTFDVTIRAQRLDIVCELQSAVGASIMATHETAVPSHGALSGPPLHTAEGAAMIWPARPHVGLSAC